MIAWDIKEGKLSDGSEVFDVVGQELSGTEASEVQMITGRGVVIHTVNLTHAVAILEMLEDADAEIEGR